MKQWTSIILGVIAIILGIAETAAAVMEFKMPLPVNIVLSVMFIALGIKTIYDVKKK